MSLKRDYTKQTTNRHFNDAEQFQLCVCPVCERVGKRVNQLLQPAYGGFVSHVIHIEYKNTSWHTDIIDSCSPATDENGDTMILPTSQTNKS